MAAEDLALFLKGLTDAVSSRKRGRPPGEKSAFVRPKGATPYHTGKPLPPPPPTPAERLLRPEWRYEAIVYLVTTTRCKCGAVSKQTNPIPLVRRTHWRWGVVEEALELSHRSPTLTALPVQLQERDVEIDNCHECLTALLEGHVESFQTFLDFLVETPSQARYWYSPANQYCMELPLE